MKRFFLILLSVVCASFLFSNAHLATSVSSVAVPSEIITNVPTLSKIDQISAVPKKEITTTAKITTTSKQSSRIVKSSTSTHNYSVTIHSSAIKSRNLSYSDIYKTKNFIYGHNTSGTLGSIKNLTSGSIFTVTENGTTSTYQVANVQIFYKSDDYTLSLCKNGYNDCTSGTYYISSLQYATFRGTKYDIALFTCDGTALGGGDSTHRRIVFANKI